VDCHRQGTWPARRSLSSFASRAKRLPGVSPSAQTLGSSGMPWRSATAARGHGPRSHGFEYRSLPSRFGTHGSPRSLASVPGCPLGREGHRASSRSPVLRSGSAASRQTPAHLRRASGFLPVPCCLTLHSSGTSTGMAPWPRARAVYHRPRGQGTTPVSAPQLKR